MSIVDVERRVAEFAAAAEGEPGWFQYAVELRADGVLVGDVAVCPHDRMRAELGFTLHRPTRDAGMPPRPSGAC